LKSKFIHLESNYIIKAPRQEIYKIITDFENLPKFFPSVAKSVKYIRRDGNEFEIEAKTKAFFGSKTFFTIRMVGKLHPSEGFISTNISSIGIEHESFLMEEIPGGTRIHYVNDVQIKSRFFRIFSFLIKGVALWYWERAVIDKLRRMLEKR
jgi:carbon monoxide dehydrogenase subunit G